MNLNLTTKIKHHREHKAEQPFVINGLTSEQWFLLFNNFIKQELEGDQKNQVFVFEDDDQAEKFYALCKHQHPSLFFPDLGANVYSGVYSSERSLNDRLLCLNKLHTEPGPFFFVTTLSALRLKVPSKAFFTDNAFRLEISDVLAPEDLAEKLSTMGYTFAPTTEEPGTFSRKGEIFDLYPLAGKPVRIHYFDDMIEEIYEIDPNTMRTLRDKPIESFPVYPMAGAALTQENINNFRAAMPRPALNFKPQRQLREEIFQKLDNNSFFPNFPFYFSLFFNETSTLMEELGSNATYHFFNKDEAQKNFELQMEEFFSLYELSCSNPDSEELLPSPELIYRAGSPFSGNTFHINSVHFASNFDEDYVGTVDVGVESFRTYISHKNIVSTKVDRGQYIQALAKTIVDDPKARDIWLVYRNESTLNQIKHILEPHLKQKTKQIRSMNFDLSEGFVYKGEGLFFLSEADFFIHKVTKAKKSKSQSKDVFADQLASLEVGDFVIHKEHGVGRYLGIETIQLGTQTGDFIALEYHDGDKVYVPVYKLDLVQKHSSSQASVSLANLKTKKFEQEKARASKSVKKLAFDLLEVQAKRELKKGFQFSEPDEMYQDFEKKFPFQETEDQIKAINDVLDDMMSVRPMDRLICGDVGFGKTEIAMRAAFKAVLDRKQVALLVPTTVLAFQHYNTMMKRFKDFPVNIEYISRFKSAKQTSEILKRLEDGGVDILIGTHKILSDKVKFHDLGLLIIDEEQRFGVGHKEKMKAMKENIDCLTMTATPIPRTLQMSFLGIKDLSLIQTPPPKRQSIKTYLVKEDPITIQRAIEKELNRGGQIFVVHNKVHDIEDYTAKIKKLVPSAKTVFAHGQMAEKELEKRITEFYERKYDLLVSTTIIESGIDIPSANTMIVDRADTYGLSQLHQLRGRIGRSDKKAYAYFVVPHNRNLSSIASKRLRALQTYAEMGAGFSLATSDLEIRGSGDILGAEQSGHIASIGLELYMDLLQDAIAELKHEDKPKKKSVEIQTPFHAVIPQDYIEDTGLRLKYYKKLSNSNSLEAFNSVVDELTDIYGLAPKALSNLYIILESRFHLSRISIVSAKVTSKQIVLGFGEKELEQKDQLRNKIIDFFIQRPKVYKLNPDLTVVCRFQDTVTPGTLLEFSKYIAQQIDPC